MSDEAAAVWMFASELIGLLTMVGIMVAIAMDDGTGRRGE